MTMCDEVILIVRALARKKICDWFAIYYVKLGSRDGAAVNRDRIVFVAHDTEWSKEHSE